MAKEIFKSRLGICEICETVDAKYTCPACGVNTCSLLCCKKHKKDNDCDGVGMRTSFVKLEDFGSLNLLSDYRLLDDISCKVDTCRRDKLTKGANLPQHRIRTKSTKLKQAVLARGADLVILPSQFIRHKNNTSIFDFRNKLINWKIQLIFLNASRFTVYDEKFSEEATISTLIEKYIHNPNVSPITFKKLETYRKVGLRNLSVLMKTERVPASDKKFYKLDLERSLKENFIGKTIVEFPQLFVVVNGCFTTRTAPKERNSTKILQTNFLVSSHDKPSHLQSTSMRKRNFSTSEESDDKEDVDMELEDIKLPSYRDLIQHN